LLKFHLPKGIAHPKIELTPHIPNPYDFFKNFKEYSPLWKSLGSVRFFYVFEKWCLMVTIYFIKKSTVILSNIITNYILYFNMF